MENIEKDVVEWHKKTFPNADEVAIGEKIKEELIEFLDAARINDTAGYWSELADVIITHMAYLAHSSGGKVTLADIVRLKHEKNVLRLWGEEDEHGDRPRVKGAM